VVCKLGRRASSFIDGGDAREPKLESRTERVTSFERQLEPENCSYDTRALQITGYCEVCE
jgi:hypothetical protein